MTDARFPERWLNDRRFNTLSDRDFRSYLMALAYAVANRTDGVIRPADIDLIPRFAADAIDAFIGNGLWTGIDDGWLVVDYLSTQSSRAELERDELNRVRDRERQRRHRAKPKTADSTDVTRDIHRDVTRDHAGQDRTGQDRTGSLKRNPFNESDARAREESNGSESYTPTAEQLRRIDENVRRGYEQ